MSLIDQQINELLKKKLKLEAYHKVELALSQILVEEKFIEVAEEVITNIITSLEAFRQEVEGSVIQAPSKSQEASTKKQIIEEESSGNIFSDEDTEILKEVVARAKSKTKPADPKKIPPKEDVQDKVRFAMQNRHLGGKIARTKTDMGDESGTICGLDAPHVLIKTPTGKIIKALLHEVVVQE
jgi:hypothetical protein